MFEMNGDGVSVMKLQHLLGSSLELKKSSWQHVLPLLATYPPASHFIILNFTLLTVNLPPVSYLLVSCSCIENNNC